MFVVLAGRGTPDKTIGGDMKLGVIGNVDVYKITSFGKQSLAFRTEVSQMQAFSKTLIFFCQAIDRFQAGLIVDP